MTGMVLLCVSFLEIFIVFILVFFNKTPGFDCYFHKFLIRHIKTKGTTSFSYSKKLICEADFTYPYWSHFFITKLAFLSESFFTKWFNFILHIINGVLLSCIAFVLSGDKEFFFKFFCIYLSLPCLFSIFSIGPRLSWFTPRAFGEFLGGLFFIALYFCQSGKIDGWFYLFPVLLYALLFMISKFSIQAATFGLVVISLLSLDFFLLLIIPAGFALSYLFSRGKSLELLKKQVSHLAWYCKNNFYGKMYVSSRNSVSDMLRLLYKGNLKQFAWYVFSKNSYTSVFFKTFPFYPACIFLGMNFLSEQGGNFDLYIFTPALLFFAVNARYLLFLGEAERYINYFIFFIIYFVILNMPSTILFSCVLSIFTFFTILDILMLKKVKDDEALSSVVIDKLNAIGKPINIATIPFHAAGGWRIIADTHHNWLYDARFFKSREESNRLSSYQIKYPLLNLSMLKEISRYYNLGLFIIQRDVLPDSFNFQKFLPEGMCWIYFRGYLLIGYKEIIKSFA